MEQLDLAKIHGRVQLVLLDSFQTPKAFSLFLADYAFNNNKNTTRKSKCGNLIKWGCTTPGCLWSVSISKRRAKEDAATRLSGITPGSWFISAINDKHNDCFSLRKASTRQLILLRGLHSSIVEGHSTAKARATQSLREVSGVNMEYRDATLYRAISEAKKALQVCDDYQLLPSFLLQFATKNPGSHVCCQLDDQDRFFRSFLSIGSVICAQDGWIPVLQCDGTHMKNDSYNGVCLTMIGSDGNGKNVPIAVGYVPTESIDNFVWFFANCIVGGVQFFNRALFGDRGHQRGAQKRLADLGFAVNLKFCSYHIVLNVQDRFRSVDPTIDRVRSFVMELQKATTISEYENVLAEIEAAFPTPRPVRSSVGSTTEQSVSQYLRSIHPISWTRLGNFTHTSTEVTYFQENWDSSLAFGVSVPLFGVRTTSSNEGENNALLWSGGRDQEVFLSTLAFVERASTVFSQKQGLSRQWVRQDFNVTETSYKRFLVELSQASCCSVKPVAGSTTIFEVIQPRTTSNPSKMARIYRVDIGTLQCTRCYTCEQRKVPCRHLLAALSHAGDVSHSMHELFHSSYTSTQYEFATNSVKIEIPIKSELKHEALVAKPPIYRQSGSASRSRCSQDRAKRQKRIPSRGETQGATKSSTNKSESNSELPGRLDGILEQFANQVSGAVKAARRPYTCSRCGESSGHNAARCPSLVSGDDPAGSDIVGGKYVVGSCPVAILKASRRAVTASSAAQGSTPFGEGSAIV